MNTVRMMRKHKHIYRNNRHASINVSIFVLTHVEQASAHIHPIHVTCCKSHICQPKTSLNSNGLILNGMFSLLIEATGFIKALESPTHPLVDATLYNRLIDFQM